MSIDWDKWADALAMTESVNNPDATGDRNSKDCPLAFGRWQIHPVFLDRWWPDNFTCVDATSWDDLFERCLRAFFDELAVHAGNAVTLAGWFHEHGGKGPLSDVAYMERFRKYYAR